MDEMCMKIKKAREGAWTPSLAAPVRVQRTDYDKIAVAGSVIPVFVFAVATAS